MFRTLLTWMRSIVSLSNWSCYCFYYLFRVWLKHIGLLIRQIYLDGWLHLGAHDLSCTRGWCGHHRAGMIGFHFFSSSLVLISSMGSVLLFILKSCLLLLIHLHCIWAISTAIICEFECYSCIRVITLESIMAFVIPDSHVFISLAKTRWRYEQILCL